MTSDNSIKAVSQSGYPFDLCFTTNSDAPFPRCHACIPVLYKIMNFLTFQTIELDKEEQSMESAHKQAVEDTKK